LYEVGAITQHAIISGEATAIEQPRARGNVRLTTKLRAGRSVLHSLYQAGSSKCLFPRGSRSDLDAVILNTAGGVTGGDEFFFAAHAGRDTCLSITTQACERAYKAQPDQIGQVQNTLRVSGNARINWVPQETILFNHSALNRRLSVEMDPGASLLMVEPVVFGRAAMGESLTQASFNDRIEIRRQGTPLYVDATQLHGDVAGHLAPPFLAGGAGAMASLAFVDDSAEAHLPHLRDLLPDTAGASLMGVDTLVLRLLAEDSFSLRRSLLPVLRLLNNGHVPRCWMI